MNKQNYGESYYFYFDYSNEQDGYIPLNYYTPIEKVFPDAHMLLKETLESFGDGIAYRDMKEEDMSKGDNYQQGYCHGYDDGVACVLRDLRLSMNEITRQEVDYCTTFEVPVSFLRSLFKYLEDNYDSSRWTRFDDLPPYYREVYDGNIYKDTCTALFSQVLSSSVGKGGWTNACNEVENKEVSEHLLKFYDEYNLGDIYLEDEEEYSRNYIFVQLAVELGFLTNFIVRVNREARQRKREDDQFDRAFIDTIQTTNLLQ